MLILQLLVNGIIRGSVYAMIALGFALAYRGARVFHIAYGAIYTAGAYALYGFYDILHFPFIVSVIFALLIVSILGYFCEIGIYAPLSRKKASSSIIIIASLGLYIIIVNTIALLFGNETKIVFSGVSPSYSIGGIIITQIQLIQLLCSILAVILVVLILNKTKIGVSVRGLANNPLLATVLGFDVNKIRIFIFVVGSVLAGLSAILVSSDVGVDPWGGMRILLSGIVAMVIGGIKRWKGAVLGGFLLGIIQAIVIWKLSARWQDTVTFLILILFLLFRPQGILQESMRVEEI